jgi:predicted  nucleic acid-binding Zn-ribbon protein
MSADSDESAKTALEEKLRAVEEEFEREMLARGFDPAQDDNVALTAPLAKLYAERERLRSEIDETTRED